MDNDHNVNKLIKYRIDELLWCYPDATCEAPGNRTTDKHTTASNANKNTNHDSGNDSSASVNKKVAFMFGIDINKK